MLIDVNQAYNIQRSIVQVRERLDIKDNMGRLRILVFDNLQTGLGTLFATLTPSDDNVISRGGSIPVGLTSRTLHYCDIENYLIFITKLCTVSST